MAFGFYKRKTANNFLDWKILKNSSAKKNSLQIEKEKEKQVINSFIYIQITYILHRKPFKTTPIIQKKLT